MEEYYGRRREAALRTLLAKLAAEEQAAVARMVEKHSNEMIHLIREKVGARTLSCTYNQDKYRLKEYILTRSMGTSFYAYRSILLSLNLHCKEEGIENTAPWADTGGGVQGVRIPPLWPPI